VADSVLHSKIAGMCIALSLIGISIACAAPKNSQARASASGKPAMARASVPPAPASIDTIRVHKLYVDGDFEQAIGLLETGIKENRLQSHADSVFTFKHLGVMYAANYETREKGKIFMHQLLMVEPTARIMDMYASDMIYMIFKNIQDEFEMNRAKLGRAEGHVIGNGQASPIAKTPPKEEPEVSKSNSVYWIGGTGAVVLAGVAAYFVLADQSPPPPTVKVHEVQ
jgi:hypothetical protein